MSAPILASQTSRSSTLSDDVDALVKPVDPPTLSQIYSDAAAFEKVLVGSGCIDSRGVDKDGANGFADLVAGDLTSSEKAVAGRLARLSVTQFSWMPEDLTGEEHDTDESKSSEDESWDSESTLEFPSSPEDDESGSPLQSPVIQRVQAENDDTWKLDPTQIVDLLVQEFGALTTGDDEERLLMEMDGCLLLDVIIVVSLFNWTLYLCMS